jgi:precorrin-6B methylase 2
MQLVHGHHFNETSKDYKGARSPYHLKTIERIFTDTCITPQDTVVELGAGEGGLTRVLLQHPGLKKPLYCIEPAPGMREQFRKEMAAEIAAGTVVLIDGSASQTNLPDGVKPKLFIGGDMAHWINPDATKELKARLAPGGNLAFITRSPDGTHPIVQKLHELLLDHCKEYREEGANPIVARPGPELDLKQAKHVVADAKETATSFIDSRSKEALFNYLRSRSTTGPYCKPERNNGELDADYAVRVQAAKEKVFTEIIDPLFEFAREKGLIEQINDEETIPLARVEFVAIGRPRVQEQAKGHQGHAENRKVEHTGPG